MRLHFSLNFCYRMLFGTLFVLIGSGALFTSRLPSLSWIFVLSCFLLQFFALKELYAIIAHRLNTSIDSSVSYILSAFLYALHFLFPHAISGTALGVLFLLLVTFISAIRRFSKIDGAILDISATVFGAAYVTLPLLFTIDLAFSSQPIFASQSMIPAPFWLIATIAMTKGSDMAAYFSGKMLGTTPLAPSLSPKKTIEGAIGGLIGAVSAFWLLILFFLPMPTLFEGAVYTLLALSIGAISQASDLIESLFKRDSNIKDSSSIPGLGGILDMVDSLIFTIPFMYYTLGILSEVRI